MPGLPHFCGLSPRLAGRARTDGAPEVAALTGPPRWRSESAFADALCLPVRSQARSSVNSLGDGAPQVAVQDETLVAQRDDERDQEHDHGDRAAVAVVPGEAAV